MKLFGKKNKELPKTIHDELLGNMTFNYRWWLDDKLTFKLRGKELRLDVGINSPCVEEPVTDAQRKTYSELCSHIEELREKLEKKLENEFPFIKKCDPADVFKSGAVVLSADGKCGMMIDVADEFEDAVDLEGIGAFSGNSFGIRLFPDVSLIDSVEEFDELFN